MRNKHSLLIEQLDQKLQPFDQTKKALVPERGWINTIRTTLNMTMAQLGTKLNITRQGVKNLEKSGFCKKQLNYSCFPYIKKW